MIIITLLLLLLLYSPIQLEHVRCAAAVQVFRLRKDVERASVGRESRHKRPDRFRFRFCRRAACLRPVRLSRVWHSHDRLQHLR